MKLIDKITITSQQAQKVVEFTKDGKTNLNQSLYFNTLFDNDLKLRGDYDEIAYFGGFRCAKSFSQQLAVWIICSNYPGCRALYVRDTYDQLQGSVISQFNNEFIGMGNYKYYKTDRIAKFDNGSEIRFRAFNYDTDILSAEYDLISSCQTEDLPEEVFLQFLGRLSGRILPRATLLSEGNPSAGFVKGRYKDHTREELQTMGIFAICNGKTSDNPFITKEYIDRVRANYPAWWAARYLDSEWTSVDEMVYSEFRENDHVIDPINFQYIKGLKQRGGLDYGYRTDSAINWAAIDYDGDIVIFDEWHAPGKTMDQIAKEASRWYYRLPETGKQVKQIFVADYAIKAPDRDGRNKWDELKSYGVNLIECSKDEANNIQLVNMLFKQGRLKITRNCVNTIRQMAGWKWKKVKLGSDKEMPEEPVDKDNHHCDCLNYIIGNIEGSLTANPQLNEYKKSLEYAVTTRNTGKRIVS